MEGPGSEPPGRVSDSPELLQVWKVLEISLLDSADRIPVQIQELQVREHAQSVPRNRPVRKQRHVSQSQTDSQKNRTEDMDLRLT